MRPWFMWRIFLTLGGNFLSRQMILVAIFATMTGAPTDPPSSHRRRSQVQAIISDADTNLITGHPQQAIHNTDDYQCCYCKIYQLHSQERQKNTSALSQTNTSNIEDLLTWLNNIILIPVSRFPSQAPTKRISSVSEDMHPRTFLNRINTLTNLLKSLSQEHSTWWWMVQEGADQLHDGTIVQLLTLLLH